MVTPVRRAQIGYGVIQVLLVAVKTGRTLWKMLCQPASAEGSIDFYAC